MPTREAIERFNRTLISLGNEPSIAAQRGEEIEEVAPPEEGLPDDLSDLLGEPGEGTEVPEEFGPEEPGPEESEPPAEPPSEAEEGPEPPLPEAEPPEEAAVGEEPEYPEAEEDFDFSDQEALLSSLEGFGEEETEAEDFGAEEEARAPEPPVEEAESGAAPEGAAEAPEEAAPEETAPEPDDLSFLDEEFGFEEPETAGPAEPAESAGAEEAPSEEGAPDAFEDVDLTEVEDPFAGIELGEDFDDVLEEGEPA
ncbi:MAG: periplasmic-type flagellar collar protein FlcA, partial [Spirochaetaceae bacterium]